ncbi:MAG: DUF401 family protein [Anaerolineae bacterium]|nr:DUF401 family protein [Anaerolineae bacterium]MDW8102059.1 DUF401 family protein [Anaerolineae bacterium]
MNDAWLIGKLLFILALMLFFLFRQWDVGLVIFSGAVAMGFLSGKPLAEWGTAFLKEITSRSTLELLAAVLLITTMVELLRETGSLNRLVNSLGSLLPDRRLSIPIPPAILGLLPMPGGALLSAPMVAAASHGLPLSNEDKTFFNYWFRHVWEYIVPLFPAVLIASSLTGIPIRTLLIVQTPFTFAAILAGSIVLVKRLPDRLTPFTSAEEKHIAWKDLGMALWPVAFVIAGTVGLGISLPILLILTIILIILVHKASAEKVRRALEGGFSMRNVLLILGIMGFKKMIEVAGVAPAVYRTLVAFHCPPLLMAFLIPMSVGALTGVTGAAIGITFPLLSPILMESSPHLNMVAFAFGASFIGVLLSPFHVCLVLTREYFQARWGPLYRLLLPSTALITVMAFLVYIFVPE